MILKHLCILFVLYAPGFGDPDVGKIQFKPATLNHQETTEFDANAIDTNSFKSMFGGKIDGTKSAMGTFNEIKDKIMNVVKGVDHAKKTLIKGNDGFSFRSPSSSSTTEATSLLDQKTGFLEKVESTIIGMDSDTDTTDFSTEIDANSYTDSTTIDTTIPTHLSEVSTQKGQTEISDKQQSPSKTVDFVTEAKEKTQTVFYTHTITHIITHVKSLEKQPESVRTAMVEVVTTEEEPVASTHTSTVTLSIKPEKFSSPTPSITRSVTSIHTTNVSSSATTSTTSSEAETLTTSVSSSTTSVTSTNPEINVVSLPSIKLTVTIPSSSTSETLKYTSTLPATTTPPVSKEHIEYLKALEEKVNSLYMKLDQLNKARVWGEENPTSSDTKFISTSTTSSVKPPTSMSILPSETYSQKPLGVQEPPVQKQSVQEQPVPQRIVPKVEQRKVPVQKVEQTDQTAPKVLEHHNGAKNIANMKPLPYKVSVQPQFQNHDPSKGKSGIYAKPKVVYNLGPEVDKLDEQEDPDVIIKEVEAKPKEMKPREAKWPYPQVKVNHEGEPEEEARVKQMFTPRKGENTLEFIERLVPQLESLLEQSKGESTSLSSSEYEDTPKNTINTLQNPKVDVDDTYIIKYVYEDGEEAEIDHNDPLSIPHVPPHLLNNSSPFTTFKDKTELEENYRKQQDKPNINQFSTEGNKTIEVPVDVPNERTGFTFRRTRPHKVRADQRRANSTSIPSGWWLFSSSSSKLQIAWVVVIISVAVPLI